MKVIKGLVLIADNVDALAMAGNSMNFLPEPKLNKEIKVQKMNKSSLKNFQPGLQPNSEQKVENIYFSPAIANANVVCIFSLSAVQKS